MSLDETGRQTLPGAERSHLALAVALAAALAAVVVFDVYEDATQQGEALWLTLLENSVPLALLVVFVGFSYWLYHNRERQYLALVLRWAVFGLIGIMFILLWVIGSQSYQETFKPVIMGAHTAIGGTVAGAGIGYVSARLHQSRDEIATERDRWESLFENDPAGIADLRYDGGELTIERANEEFRDLFVDDSAEGEALVAVVDHDDEAVEDAIGKAIREREVYSTAVVSRVGDSRLFLKLRVVPYGIGTDARRAFAIYTDVTELRQTQEQLEAQMEQLAESNDRLQQFAYIASHDLQEPLRMVSSYMSLLEDEYRDELDEEAKEYIDFAANGADRMQKMVDELLAYSRVETEGKEFTEADATAVLEETRQSLELRIEEVDATVTAAELPTVEADRNQLGQVFQNLIENAIDHVDQPTIHIDCEERDNEVVFSVSDDGPGIPESQQDRIFDLFERGHRDGDGTGMGLAICDRILSRHGGNIWVESADDGTTFYFSVPR
ncbi:PAS fold-containing protein [Halovenus aranensis]|uniref:histidine kinase n=1 Tax=Halovenus aranensis TaxID=890420 RepID=A0A1G8XGI3_9EURY|nr:ATP-binding protein [Halovenus aranensis]SDJ88850.1 PAS fold-containing protein [Halovenus aranensis]